MPNMKFSESKFKCNTSTGKSLRLFQFFGIILVFAWQDIALAVLDLQVKESLEVYESADRHSKVIVVAEPGDRFVVSPVEYGAFRKILLVGFKQEEGYVLKEKMKRSTIRERFWAQGKEKYHMNYGLGLLALYTDATIKSVPFTTSGGLSYLSDKMHGTSTSMGLFVDLPINVDWAGRFAYASRKISVAAEAKPQNGSVGNQVDLHSEQVYKSLSGEIKYYFSHDVEMWGGFGIEQFTLDNANFYIFNSGGGLIYIPVELPQSTSTVFIATGMDISLGSKGKVYLLPEIRIFQSMDSNFEIKIYEAFLGLAWKW